MTLTATATEVVLTLTPDEAKVLHDILVAFSYARPRAMSTPTLDYEVEFADDLMERLATVFFPS